jgi:hypothetical protein
LTFIEAPRKLIILNALGIDPKNLSFDFKRDWHLFSESRVKLFLVTWLRRELRSSWQLMENVAPADLGKAQGAIFEIKKMLNVLECQQCPDTALREVITFLEKKD